MSYAEKKYWKRYYEDNDVVGNKSPQQNVGRTKKGRPITDALWRETLTDLEKLLAITNNQVILELCCGNGEVIGNLAPKCRKAIGVDYSEKLLQQMEAKYGRLVEALHADVLEANFANESVDIVIIYFSIQHFDEKETAQLVGKSLGWLKKGGRLFIGDIPNSVKKWEYINKPEFKRDYIKRVLEDEPMIGNWYQPQFFEALQYYFEGISVKIIEQPNYHINSSYRFDVLIEKE